MYACMYVCMYVCMYNSECRMNNVKNVSYTFFTLFDILHYLNVHSNTNTFLYKYKYILIQIQSYTNKNVFV